MTNLIDHGGLQQETGLLKERWGQDGSNIVSFGGAVAAGTATEYTVSANKKLFVKSFVATSGGAAQTLILYDGAVEKCRINIPAVFGEPVPLILDTPYIFSTDVNHSLLPLGTAITLNWSGWEE